VSGVPENTSAIHGTTSWQPGTFVSPAPVTPDASAPLVAAPVGVTDLSPFGDLVDSRPGGLVDSRPGDLVDDWVAAASCSSPSPGPDGRLAYVGDRDGAPALWIRAVDGSERRVDTGPGHVRSVIWSPSGEWIAVLVAPGGGERTEVRVVRPDGGGVHRLAGGPADSGAATAAVPGRWTPDGAALAVAESVGRLTHALLVAPDTGRREHLAVGQALTICDVRPHGRGHRLLVREGPRGVRRLLLVDSATGRYQPLLDGMATVVAARFAEGDAGERVAYVLSNAGRERAALVEVTLDAAGAPAACRTVVSRHDADLERFAVLPGGLLAAVVWNVGGRSELGLVTLTGRRKRVLPPLPGDVVTSLIVDAAGRQLLLAVDGATSPGELWTYDLSAADRFSADLNAAPSAYRCLVSHAPTAFPTHTLASVDADSPTTDLPTAPARLVRPVSRAFPAHDGLELSGLLYRPAGSRGPLPTFLYFHGGPESQERPTFNPLFQALLARGIAVFAANVRGSTGYGRSYEEADDRDRRAAGILDAATCVDYLVRAGLAEPGRIGVGGRSYGGYLTLAALVTYPDLFQVGVDICGVADFETFYAHTEPWIAGPAVTKYGDPQADRALLRRFSPLHRMDALAAPLMVVHGEHDTNVPVYEAEQTVKAARSRGVDCRYLLFEDEGHEIHGLANRTEYVREVVAWLSRYLLDDAGPVALTEVGLSAGASEWSSRRRRTARASTPSSLSLRWHSAGRARPGRTHPESV
jgi:dipeptidyl aminopeptidase/acylaminoacyl peptidase